ncbi:helix-turn-helix domain-containing protein [Streptomyces sp. MT206]|uniref:helix-turn-helix domain-containing protein n=1 Tax=Streptomyces sp. MT206 TaxID=3031407 RepID=UPI002FC97A6F
MSEQQRGRRAIEAGPTGKTVADNLARLRKVRGFTTRQLSGLLERNGRPIPASGITRMEKAERQVTVDELVALAVALGVSPAALLLPLTPSGDEAVDVTGAGSASAADAWAWASSRRPLRLSEEGASTELLEYQLYGLPVWARDLWAHIRQIDELMALPPRRVGAVLDGLLEELERDREAGADG